MNKEEWAKHGEKCCTSCGISKPLQKGFYLRKDGSGTYRSHCKACCRKQDQEYTKKNLAAVRRKAQRYRKENQVTTMLWVARNRAKKKGWEYSLEPSDIIIPEYCPVLGLKLETQIGRAADNSPSLDRINSGKGYIKGNVQVISRRANILKNNATLSEVEAIYFWMRGHNEQSD